MKKIVFQCDFWKRLLDNRRRNKVAKDALNAKSEDSRQKFMELYDHQVTSRIWKETSMH